MTQASKIHLSASRDIPFNKLVLSQSNVRRIKAGLAIEDLAADIAQRTLLQSLCVRPMRDADGNETGMFEVPAGDLPTESKTLWDRLANFDDTTRLSLLAHCISFGVNAVQEKVDRYSGSAMRRRIAEADRLARAVRLDMVEAGWRPTADNYLGRVPKTRILEAVMEAKGLEAARRIEGLKKPDMAKEAELLLERSGWLPEPLRPIGMESSEAKSLAAAEDDDEQAGDLDGPVSVAAE